MCCAPPPPCAHWGRNTREGADWLVCGRGIGGLTPPGDVLDMGNSGTAARLLAGILATARFSSVMTGDASLRKRPMGRVIEPLKALGRCSRRGRATGCR